MRTIRKIIRWLLLPIEITVAFFAILIGTLVMIQAADALSESPPALRYVRHYRPKHLYRRGS